ncbi:MAG: hypothetical protein HC853_18685 [Anaerolineae bacterium]|nr:hypothetical protein [Anaerolineae bacterium]
MHSHPRIALLGTVIKDTELLHARGALASYGGKDVIRWIDMRNHQRPSATHAEAPDIADVFYVPATPPSCARRRWRGRAA